MKENLLRKVAQELGRRGGRARAAKYGKETLSWWGKKGGRPKGTGKKVR